jgi:hypothetical protein
MNHSVWHDVITELTPTFRCIAPALPLGAHRQPMRCYFISWPAAAGSGSMWRWQLWSHRDEHRLSRGARLYAAADHGAKSPAAMSFAVFPVCIPTPDQPHSRRAS